MDTLLLTPEQTGAAADIIKRGGMVAIPTETVYGLAASAFNTDAIRKVFEAKGRPQDNPLIVHIAELSALAELCEDIPASAYKLAELFWPGPLTMVLKKKSIIPDDVTAGMPNVAVRMPSHPVARDIIKKSGLPLAAPSANLSGSPSPTTCAHVLGDLFGKVDAIVDGGDCSVGVESTVIDMTSSPLRLLRPGGVTLEQLKSALGEVAVDKAVFGSISENDRVSSPGMKYRHYAPKAHVTAVCGGGDATADYIRFTAKENDGIICFNGYKRRFSQRSVIEYGGEDRPEELAHNIFDSLRKIDRRSPACVYIQCPDEGGVGLAVANRIKKAAGFDVVYL